MGHGDAGWVCGRVKFEFVVRETRFARGEGKCILLKNGFFREYPVKMDWSGRALRMSTAGQLAGKGEVCGRGGEPTASRRPSLRSAALCRSSAWTAGFGAGRSGVAVSGLAEAVAWRYAGHPTKDDRPATHERCPTLRADSGLGSPVVRAECNAQARGQGD